MKIILLTQDKSTIIDDIDYELVSRYKWYWVKKNRSKYGYAQRTIRTKTGKLHIDLHRFLIDAKKGQIVDHINGISLDNRRENLRFVTPKQNAQNSMRPVTNKSGYKGVSWHKGARKWRVTIKPNQKQINLGFYTDLKEAAKAYNKGARKYFGEFARLNTV